MSREWWRRPVQGGLKIDRFFQHFHPCRLARQGVCSFAQPLTLAPAITVGRRFGLRLHYFKTMFSTLLAGP